MKDHNWPGGKPHQRVYYRGRIEGLRKEEPTPNGCAIVGWTLLIAVFCGLLFLLLGVET